MPELTQIPLKELIVVIPQLSVYIKNHFGQVKLNDLNLEELIDRYFAAGYQYNDTTKEAYIEKFYAFYKSCIETFGKLQYNFNHLTINEGIDKNQKEHQYQVDLVKGVATALVGPTSSGKSALLDDIEGFVSGSSQTHRHILIDGHRIPTEISDQSKNLVTRISLSYTKCIEGSATVGDFILKHLPPNFEKHISVLRNIISTANTLVEESIERTTRLEDISERQMKALLIADIAVTNTSPILLLDELESFGIDKYRAFRLLVNKSRISIIATHDPLLILMCSNRVVMKNGAIAQVIETTEKEKALMQELIQTEKKHSAYRDSFRNGEVILL